MGMDSFTSGLSLSERMECKRMQQVAEKSMLLNPRKRSEYLHKKAENERKRGS